MTEKVTLPGQNFQLNNLSKEELEKLKLEVEIREIEQNITSTRKGGFRKDLRGWLALTMAFVTLVTAFLALWSNWSAFLQEKRIARQIKYSNDMVKLVNQLESNDEHERENALLLLGYFKMNALPILLNYLERTADPQIVIRPLKLIQRNIDKPVQLTDQLLKSAENIFSITDVTTEEVITAYINYIRVLAEVGADRRQKIVDLLNGLKADLKKTSNPKRKYKKLEKEFILKEVDDALQKLS